MNIIELIIRIAIGFIVLFTLTRMMGRKEISQMTFFNFVSAIAIGSVTANLVVNQNLSIHNGVIALIGWSLFTLIMDFIDIKSKKLRKIVTGDPVIVIKEGKIVEKAFHKTRLDLDSLNAMLRKQKIFSMADVDYAIFETDGKLSVMKKEDKKVLTKMDMNIPTISKVFPIPTEVISDGKILTKNLGNLNLNTDWLSQQLKQLNINSASEVFFGQIQTDGTLFVDKKKKD
ncbi:YetF domain-containing protein [Oceanobacillus rekensis]|uniref:YetF domain-containing protein n=1 Tax=Oceanobacillus rekensis TaxID=937927 RepID=UPI000B433754|nr:DUF421 domain-containing protein [Oceanobacillus rekensis]